MTYICLYSSYLESLAPYSDQEVGCLVRGMLGYAALGEVPRFEGNERFIWPTLKDQIDRDAASYQEKCEKNRQNGAKGGRPKNQTVSQETERLYEKPKKAKEKEKNKEKEKKKEKENIPRADADTKTPSMEYGVYGWVKLTQAEYDRLICDLGQAEADRCITYIDESAQATGNKNKWKDWNLVVRKCSRENWGKARHNPTEQPKEQRSSVERLRDMISGGIFDE